MFSKLLDKYATDGHDGILSDTDVQESDWYYAAVIFLAQKDITKGTTATTFSPDATLTRG
jgi:hypothetical protein